MAELLLITPIRNWRAAGYSIPLHYKFQASLICKRSKVLVYRELVESMPGMKVVHEMMSYGPTMELAVVSETTDQMLLLKLTMP